MAGVVVCDDMIAEILAKLPVKSLMRFNCVCKTWYSVISDPQFCNNLHRMRPCVLICEKLGKFSTITIESSLTIRNRAPTPLSLPWETEADDRYGTNLFLGSCNGLVCVDHKSKSSPDRSGLIFWNPSTRKFRRLPRPGCYSLVHYDIWTYAWLGYDELIDDYKLVWLNSSGIFRPPIVTELDVFTLKSNTWRRPPVDHIALRGINPKSIGVLSNGAIHWLTNYSPPSGDTDQRILALDLATEKLRLLKFSHALLVSTAWVGSLFGGCLCLCSDGYENRCYVRDLWMMKEYGVESSWTKVLSIPLPGFGTYYPILFLKEGKENVAMCDSACEQEGKEIVAMCDTAYEHRPVIVKLRVEGAKKAMFEETMVCVPRDRSQYNVVLHMNNVVLHMKESMVSLFL